MPLGAGGRALWNGEALDKGWQRDHRVRLPATLRLGLSGGGVWAWAQRGGLETCGIRRLRSAQGFGMARGQVEGGRNCAGGEGMAAASGGMGVVGHGWGRRQREPGPWAAGLEEAAVKGVTLRLQVLSWQ